jgi:hypothetical protein
MSRCCNPRASTSLACSNATCVDGSLGGGDGIPSDEEDEDDERLVGE